MRFKFYYFHILWGVPVDDPLIPVFRCYSWAFWPRGETQLIWQRDGKIWGICRTD